MSLPNTHLGPAAITALLDGKKNLFFDGIGGVSMNSLAHISHLRGFTVSGYDRAPSPITRTLEAMGITVYYEAAASHVDTCDALIYTVAMPETNPEYMAAQERGIPLLSRADFLGYLMTGYTHRIGVSGTHGKSTTTGMLAHIFTEAQTRPTVLSGAPLKETGTPDLIGSHELFVFEACEYMDSFLDFCPTTAVVLNIEMDHLDYFHSIEQMRSSFTRFMNRTGPDGYAIFNWNDPNCRLAAEQYTGHPVTFARNNPEADFYSVHEHDVHGYPAFDVASHGEILASVQLRVPGDHCISDALASFASCSLAGLAPAVIAAGLSSYTGVARRMEPICQTQAGAVVYTDYAHHPTEIQTTLAGARKICPGQLRVIFQPHTYSRTFELFDDFVHALASSPADEIILCDIYAARETNTYGVSSEALAERIRACGKPCSLAPDFETAARTAEQISGPEDMILVMGAGDVIRVAQILQTHAVKPCLS